MYLPRVIFFLIFCSSSNIVLCQNFSLEGRVLDSITRSPIQKSDIILSLANDSTQIYRTLSGDNGSFSFNNIPQGIYYFQLHSRNIKSLDLININQPIKKDFYVSNIQTKNIKEILLIKQKPLIDQKPDKTVITIDKSIYDTGRNSYDLLNKLPEVYADPLGNINFRGDQGVSIYIDGRKVNIPSSQIKGYLKTIPSENINSYEIVSTPGSEYEAQGTSAIINIITKKNKEYGFSGSLNANLLQTRYTTTNLGGTLNYRKNKWNFSTLFNYDNNVFYSTTKSERQYKQEDRFLTQEYYYKEKYDNYALTTGVEYELNKNSKIGGQYQLNYIDWNVNSNSSLQMDSITLTHNNKKEFVNNQNVNLYYKLKLDSSNADLTLNYDFLNYNNPSDSYYINSTQDNTPFEMYYIDNPIKIKINTFSADFNKQFEHFIWQSGAKLSFIRTDNNNIYFQKQNNQDVIDYSRTNHFTYQEDIQALYSNITYSFEKDWTAKLGLRAENTLYKGISNQDEFKRNRFDLFPSFFLRKKLNNKQVLNLSYVLRIQRPAYEFLNPFIDYQDPYSIKTGNTNLKPAFSNLVELKYIKNSKYSLTLSYKNTKNLIGQIYTTQDNLVYATTYDNISTENIYTLSSNIPVKVTSWWDTNIYSYVNYKSVTFSEGENKGKYTLGSFFVRNSNIFNLPDDYSLELSGFYKGTSLFYIYKSKPQYSVDFSFKKSWKNMSVSAELTDIFNSLESRVINDNAAIHQYSRTKYPTRVLSVGFSYNFAKGKKEATQYDGDEKNSDEKDRIER